VTGHTGFKGAWLCKILEHLGADVYGYALAPPTSPNIYDICKPAAYSIIGDVRDFDGLKSAFTLSRPEIVIHMAAQPLVLESYQNPKYTYEVNVMGTVNILECARIIGGVHSFLNVTTDKVYLNLERNKGYTEDERLDGHDPYSNSKSCSELVTATYNRAFLRDGGTAVSTVRSGNVIGGGDFSEKRIIPDCARGAIAQTPIYIRNPNSIRPYQHVLDTLFAYLLLAEAQYKNPDLASAYNIGPHEADCISGGQLADKFCKAWGGGINWTHQAMENPIESIILQLDCTKIKNVLGWIPQWQIDQAVEETAAWYKAYAKGNPNHVMEEQIKKFADFYGG